LKKAGVTGTVRVRLHITKAGTVTSPELVSASDPAFGDAALAAVVKWKFDPAMKARKFVEATIEVPIRFQPPKSPK
jgi:TonB family protein